MTTQNKPIHEVHVGPVRAAIWRNETEKGTFYSVRFSRLYQANGQLNYTDSIRPTDLTELEELAKHVRTWLRRQPGVLSEPLGID